MVIKGLLIPLLSPYLLNSFLISAETDYTELFRLVCPPPKVDVVCTIGEHLNMRLLGWTITPDAEDERLFRYIYPLHADQDRRTGVNVEQPDNPTVIASRILTDSCLGSWCLCSLCYEKTCLSSYPCSHP